MKKNRSFNDNAAGEGHNLEKKNEKKRGQFTPIKGQAIQVKSNILNGTSSNALFPVNFAGKDAGNLLVVLPELPWTSMLLNEDAKSRRPSTHLFHDLNLK